MSDGLAILERPLRYGSVGDEVLWAEHYQPLGSAAADVLVDVHGGAFSSGNRFAGQRYCRRLARAGFSVLSIEFRHGPDHKHPAALEDIARAVRFCRDGGLGFAPGRVGLIGSSSGGHLVVLTALEPTEQGADIDCEADFVVALWPVSNPAARYQYLLSRQLETAEMLDGWDPFRLAEGHRGYFVSQMQMLTASLQDVLVRGTFRRLPPLLIVQPELDRNVPVFMSQTFHGAYRHAGGNVEYRLYPGVGHGFAAAETDQTDNCLADIVAFIRRMAPVAGTG